MRGTGSDRLCGWLVALAMLWVGGVSAAADVPRVEHGGRVVVIDDFEHGLGAWGGNAAVEIGKGVGGGKAVLWRCADVPSRLVYKHVDKIPDRPRYTRITFDMRGWDIDGVKGPGVATWGDISWGGLPWQLTDQPPLWSLHDPRPVFGDQWRHMSIRTDYPEWYNFTTKVDNSKPSLWFQMQTWFAKSGVFMLDNIRLVDDPIEVLGKEEDGPWGEGQARPSGDYRYTYTIRLRNRTDKTQTVKATADTTVLKRFTGGLVTGSVRLAPGKDGHLVAYVDIPKSVLGAVRDLYHEELLVTVCAQGAPGTEHVLPLLATKPLPRLPKPFMLHTPGFWQKERARLAKQSPAERAKALKAADALLRKDMPFPTKPTITKPRHLNNGTDVQIPWWSKEDTARIEANFKAVRTLGEAYQRTLDQRYARKAVAMMVDLAHAYAIWPWHGNYEVSDRGQAKFAMNNLHESFWMIDLAGSMDLVWRSTALTPAHKETIKRRFLLPAARHQTIVCSAFTNMTTTRNLSAALCALLADDAHMVQHAVYGHHGLAIAAETSISPDGFTTEIPINYHWGNVRHKLRQVLVYRHAGLKIDVASQRIKKACDSPYLRAMPNQQAPPFGCCGYGTGAPFNFGDYPAAHALFGDPMYRRLVDKTQAQAIIDGLPSIAFQQGGLACLRQRGRTGPDRTYLAILSSNRRRCPDGSLHFVLYSDGLLLCPSPGSLYNARGHAKWTSPWRSTIYVDDQPQRPAWGKILAHDFSGHAQMALIDAGPIYDGVTLRRAVALAHGLVFIVDRVTSSAEHVYDRVQMASQQIARAPAGTTNLTLNKGKHIRLKGMRIDADWSMQWKSTGPSLELAMVGAPGTEVYWGYNQVNGYRPAMCAPTVVADARPRTRRS